jgi:hypothetical protein
MIELLEATANIISYAKGRPMLQIDCPEGGVFDIHDRHSINIFIYKSALAPFMGRR